MFGRLRSGFSSKKYSSFFESNESIEDFTEIKCDDSIVSMSAGKEHSLFLTSNGGVWSISSDSTVNGRGGDGGDGGDEMIGEIKAFKEAGVDITSVSCGDGHNLVVTKEGDIISWGKVRDGTFLHTL